jgi:hypothetical protein
VNRIVLKDWTWYNGSLAGAVYGHPSFVDGTRIITSPLVCIDLEAATARTRNSMYHLEDPLPSAEVLATAVEQ